MLVEIRVGRDGSGNEVVGVFLLVVERMFCMRGGFHFWSKRCSGRCSLTLLLFNSPCNQLMKIDSCGECEDRRRAYPIDCWWRDDLFAVCVRQCLLIFLLFQSSC